VADDKSTYTYVPEMVRFYLGEEPILSNVPTCVATAATTSIRDRAALRTGVKENPRLWRQGMLVGPTSSKIEIEEFPALLKSRPDNYIAQPTLALSTADLRQPGRGATPCRPPALRAVGRKITSFPAASRAWREGRLAGGEFEQAAAPKTLGAGAGSHRLAGGCAPLSLLGARHSSGAISVCSGE